MKDEGCGMKKKRLTMSDEREVKSTSDFIFHLSSFALHPSSLILHPFVVVNSAHTVSMSDQPRTEKESTMERAPRRRTAPWFLGGLVLLLLFMLVALQAFGLWTVVPPDATADTLLLYALSSLNFAAFIVFSFIFIRNLLKLRRERRERQLGSKIKTRLVVSFISLSLLPITAMALFSYLFFNRTLEKWFSSLPEEIIRKATEEERKAVITRSRTLRRHARRAARRGTRTHSLASGGGRKSRRR
jgi:hypothetical protein